jgi:hypothetical protein
LFKAQVHTITPVQSSTTESDEIQQLQTNLALLTTQCARFDEANRAWQQFHQNELESFRNKLQDWISLDVNSNLEQYAQQIVTQLEQDKHSLLQNNNQIGKILPTRKISMINKRFDQLFLSIKYYVD